MSLKLFVFVSTYLLLAFSAVTFFKAQIRYWQHYRCRSQRGSRAVLDEEPPPVNRKRRSRRSTGVPFDDEPAPLPLSIDEPATPAVPLDGETIPAIRKRPPFCSWLKEKRGKQLALAAVIYCVVNVAGFSYHFPTATASRDAGLSDRYKELWKEYVALTCDVAKGADDLKTLFKLARSQKELGLGAKALNTYRRILMLDPDSLTGHLELGCLALAMKNSSLAAAQVRELDRAWPGRPESHLLQAQIEVRSGRLSQAVTQWRAALAKDPANHEALAMLTADSLRQRNFAEAVSYAEAGHKAAPEDQGLLLNLVRSQVGLGNHAAAEATLRREIGRDKVSPAPLLLLAELQLGRKEYLPAIATYEEILKRDPQEFQAMNNIAQLTADHGYDLERAVKLASYLYAKFPHDPAIADTLGWVLCRQGKTAEALPLLQMAVKGAPDNVTHRYHYGVALVKQGEKAAGRTELATALKVSGSFDGAAQARTLLAAN